MLLMHEDEMPTLPQIGIHLTSAEWSPRPAFALFRSLNNLFKQGLNIGVEIVSALFECGLFDDFGQDAKVIERVD